MVVATITGCPVEGSVVPIEKLLNPPPMAFVPRGQVGSTETGWGPSGALSETPTIPAGGLALAH
jgi:hypothetical protein